MSFFLRRAFNFKNWKWIKIQGLMTLTCFKKMCQIFSLRFCTRFLTIGKFPFRVKISYIRRSLSLALVSRNNGELYTKNDLKKLFAINWKIERSIRNPDSHFCASNRTLESTGTFRDLPPKDFNSVPKGEHLSNPNIDWI